MPTTYTHYRFGKEVLSCLPFPIRTSIENHRELYDIGLHGPDILFYYKALSKNHVNQSGFRMHDEPASKFFLQARQLLEHCPDKTAGRVYLYGFVCHFALDSICHPYVEKSFQVSSICHCELESELDRAFLLEDNLNPAKYQTCSLVQPSEKNAEVISTFFEGITSKEILGALKGMVQDLKLLHPKSRLMKNTLRSVLHTLKLPDIEGMILRPETNPNAEKYCNILKKMYEEAIPVASSLIQRYQDVLLNGAQLPDRFDLTFGAGDHWEELLL